MLANSGIVRNRLKIQSVVNNAQAFIAVQNEFGSFDSYIWGFVDGVAVQNNWANATEVLASNEVSLLMSKDLKKRGFKFIGSVICYAFMQAIGMVNDHTVNCFRHSELIDVE